MIFLAGMTDADSGTGEHENIPVMAYVMNELTYHLTGSQRQLHQFGRFVRRTLSSLPQGGCEC